MTSLERISAKDAEEVVAKINPEAFVQFTVPGTPVAKGRPRFTRNGYAFTPAATRAYEKSVSEYAQLAMLMLRRKTTTAPLAVTIALYFPIPSSWSKRAKARALMGAVYPVKADVDNCAKAILDGMNSVVFADDTQVVSLTVTKEYSEHPRASIVIRDGLGVYSQEAA